MIHRYFQLLEHLDATDDDLVDFLPAHAANKRHKALLQDLRKVESVSKALQGDGASILDVRVWFDGLIAVKPHYARYLAPRAEIVHSPDFESGCVRIQKGSTDRLTRAEKAVLEPFRRLKEGARLEEGSDSEDEPSFVEVLQKRRRLEDVEQCYDLLSIIPPTSNVAERFFSVARATYSQERHSLLPITFEMILFLRLNSAYWTALTVDEATR